MSLVQFFVLGQKNAETSDGVPHTQICTSNNSPGQMHLEVDTPLCDVPFLFNVLEISIIQPTG